MLITSPGIIRRRSTNPVHLERWLGADKVASVSHAMCNDAAKWYGPPIAVGGVPGEVYATKDGDFIGECRAGHEMSALDRAFDWQRRFKRAIRVASRESRTKLHTFSSLSDIISECTGGKRYEFHFNKVGTTGVVNATNSLWGATGQPTAGANGSAAGAGRACSRTTTGAFPYNLPGSGDTLHLVSGWPLATLSNTLLLYDRIYDVAKTMSSSATEAVTGTPTRYSSPTSSALDYAGGNFLFVECNGALSNNAHNWTTCLYTDQDGNTGATLPSLTGNAQNIVNRLDHPTGQWFAPLASGDFGLTALTQMQCSSASVTGTISFVIGHPLMWMPCQIATNMVPVDGINTAFSLSRVFDGACMAFLEVIKPAVTATTYVGSFYGVSG